MTSLSTLFLISSLIYLCIIIYKFVTKTNCFYFIFGFSVFFSLYFFYGKADYWTLSYILITAILVFFVYCCFYFGSIKNLLKYVFDIFTGHERHSISLTTLSIILSYFNCNFNIKAAS